MTTYYEVVIQLLRKTCEETVQLLSCCLWRKKTRKKKIWINFQLATAAKETEQKLQDTNFLVWPFVYLSIFETIYFSIYLYLFNIY